MRDLFRPNAEVMGAGPESAEFRMSRILDECLEQIRNRRSTVTECLERYPELSEQLAPLLQVAVELASLSQIQPSAQFKQATRKRLLQADTVPGTKRTTRVRRAAGILTGVIFLAGLGVLALAGSSVPGNPLYSVKRGTEYLQLAFAADSASRADTHVFFAERRLSEVEILARDGDADLAEQAAAEYGREMAFALDTYRSQPGNLADLQKLLLERLSAHQAELRSQASAVPAASRRALDHAMVYSQGIMEQIRLSTQ